MKDIHVEGIVLAGENMISFGNFAVKDKLKVNDFNLGDDTYSLRTYTEATKLEKNDQLALETVPGTAVHKFYKKNKDYLEFTIYGSASTIITLGLEPNALYRIKTGKDSTGMESSASGKVKFSVDLSSGKPVEVSVERLEKAE